MQNCFGRKQRDLERSITTTTEALDQAMLEAQALKKINGRASPRRRRQLKNCIGRNLKRLKKAVVRAEQQNLDIDTVRLNKRIKVYETFFQAHLPNSARLPQPTDSIRHSSFNRRGQRPTPHFHMGIIVR